MYGPAHRSCSVHRNASRLVYVIERSLLLNILKSSTSRVHGLRILCASAIQLSCASRTLSLASSNEAWNHSMNAVSSRHHILSCCYWQATKSNQIDVVYSGSNLHGLQSVDECVDMLYAYSTSGRMVSLWSWRWVMKAWKCGVTCIFEISVSPSVCGWNAIDMSSFIYDVLLTSTQKSNVECASL